MSKGLKMRVALLVPYLLSYFICSPAVGQQVVEALSEQCAKRYLILDRYATYGHEFRRRVQSWGVKEVISALGLAECIRGSG